MVFFLEKILPNLLNMASPPRSFLSSRLAKFLFLFACRSQADRGDRASPWRFAQFLPFTRDLPPPDSWLSAVDPRGERHPRGERGAPRADPLLSKSAQFSSQTNTPTTKADISKADLSPILYVIGLTGPKIEAEIHRSQDDGFPHWYCAHFPQNDVKNYSLWLDPRSLLKPGSDCWLDNHRFRWAIKKNASSDGLPEVRLVGSIMFLRN